MKKNTIKLFYNCIEILLWITFIVIGTFILANLIPMIAEGDISKGLTF